MSTLLKAESMIPRDLVIASLTVRKNRDQAHEG